MKIQRALTLVLCAGLAVLMGSCRTSNDATATALVGVTYRDFVDLDRQSWTDEGPRPLRTTIWYPACSACRPRRQRIAIFNTGQYEVDACWSTEEDKLPLIVVSHGTGGSAASIAWLCVRLASEGFVVAAVDHHGNTSRERKLLLEGFVRWPERPMDLHVLVDELLADPVIGERIDATRIGAAGFSLGGYTALAAAGVRLDVGRWIPFCSANPLDPLCQLPPEARGITDDLATYLQGELNAAATLQANGDFRDTRIKAAFAIAPVGGPLITVESARAVTIPVAMVVGEDDDQSVPSQTAQPLAELLPDCMLEIQPGATHYTFLTEGTWWAKLFARRFFGDPEGVTRREVHNATAQMASDFFRSSL